MDHARTILATVATVGFIMFPGIPAGMIAKALYGWFLVGYVSHSWFAAPMLTWFPEMLGGIVAGAFGACLGSLAVKRADFNVVAYAAGSVVVALHVLIAILAAQQFAGTLEVVAFVGSGVGFLTGTVMGCQSAVSQGAGTQSSISRA